jgi:hypothetical protein
MRLLLSALAALLCAACSGYHVGPVKPTRMKNVHRVCVKNFKNETLEPRMESVVTSAIIKQLHLDGTYEVTNEARADAILDGSLTRIERTPSRVLRGNVLQSTEYLLTLRGTYRLTESGGGQVLDSRSVTGTTSFFVTPGSGTQPLITADTAQDERQAIPLAAEDLGIKIAGYISEGW